MLPCRKEGTKSRGRRWTFSHTNAGRVRSDLLSTLPPRTVGPGTGAFAVTASATAWERVCALPLHLLAHFNKRKQRTVSN